MTASIGASCHIVQHSECQKYTAKMKTIPLTTITTPREVHNSPLVPSVLRASASAIMYPFLASLSPAGELLLLFDDVRCLQRHRSLAFFVPKTFPPSPMTNHLSRDILTTLVRLVAKASPCTCVFLQDFVTGVSFFWRSWSVPVPVSSRLRRLHHLISIDLRCFPHWK